MLLCIEIEDFCNLVMRCTDHFKTQYELLNLKENLLISDLAVFFSDSFILF